MVLEGSFDFGAVDVGVDAEQVAHVYALDHEHAVLEQQHALVSAVAAANKAGFTIRVALIYSNYDLGSVTVLWRRPRTYARFLGAELGFVYKQRLLIVMPNGFGFNWPKHPTTAEYALLAKLPIYRGAAGLLESATAAVQALAKAG
jgi:hypothetical protein